MQILLDSAIISEARQAVEWGWIDSVTTNPTLLAKSPLSPIETLQELAKILPGQIFYQLTGQDLQSMLNEAEQVHGILGKHLVLKIPATALGFQAAVRLSPKYPVCITAIFSPAQGMLAGTVGARYAVYYHNRAKRLLPEGQGARLGEELVKVLAGTDTEVGAASLKSPEEVVEARLAGVTFFTTTLSVLEQMSQNTVTAQAMEEFNAKGAGILKS
jgi:transaldolase